MTKRATSDYLNRPLRTLAEAERDLGRPENAIRRLLMHIPFLKDTKVTE